MRLFVPQAAALVVALTTACKGSTAARVAVTTEATAGARYSGPVIPPPPGALSVKDFGARGNGTVDDRAAIQDTIDAARGKSGHVYFPPGTYLVSQTGRSYWGIDVPSGIQLHGAGRDATVLRQTGGTGTSVRLLRLSGDDIVVEHLTLDGNRASQTPNEHRHGIFAIDADRLIVRHVTARDFTGDGFYLSSRVNGATFFDVLAAGNDRSGIALGSVIDGTRLVNSRFIANGAQQVDSEPVALDVVSNTTVIGCTLDGAGVSNGYALTVSGTPKAKGHGWNVVGNRIDGGVFVVWAKDVRIEGNHGVNPTTKPSVTVYRASSDVSILANRFKLTQDRVRSVAGILVQGTGTGDAPNRVLVAKNDIEVTHAESFGVRVEGAIDVTVVDNVLRGSGRAAPRFAGIYVRATNEKEDFRRAVVRGNTIRDIGDRGISVVGNGKAKLLSIEIQDNTFDNEIPNSAMTSAMSLDDGTGAARQISVRGNRSLRGVTRSVMTYPAKAATLTIDEPSQQLTEQ